MDDDEWVERLRRAVAEGTPAVQERDDHAPMQPAETPAADTHSALPDVDLAALTGALRTLEQAMRQLDDKLASVDARLRLLEHQRESIVDQIADAVVARLEARPQPTPERGWRGAASRWLSG